VKLFGSLQKYAQPLFWYYNSAEMEAFYGFYRTYGFTRCCRRQR